jgi:geranylgeranyl diphosphate synthase, type II
MTLVPRFFAEYQDRIDGELGRVVHGSSDRVQEAMAYAVPAPSKRIRPVLTLLTAELCGGSAARAMTAACSIEMVHAASLILDDLPAMDDSPVRRGKPATHVAFGEAIALLAAFGLLNGAFNALARGYIAGRAGSTRRALWRPRCRS